MDVLTTKTQLFDRWAPSYDWLLPSVLYQAVHVRLLEYVQLSEAAPVLDLGCGTGRLLNRLAQTFPSLQGTGLDLSPEMLHQARLRCRYSNRLTFVRGVSHTIPAQDQEFEAVFSTISFLHYPEPARVLTEVHRVLQPQGRFYLVDYTTPFSAGLSQLFSTAALQFYNRQEREEMGRQAGFHCTQHVNLLGPILLTIFTRI